MKNNNKKQLAVIFGGQSGEHEVSLRSSNQVMERKYSKLFRQLFYQCFYRRSTHQD